jgi:hypothetical protein
VCAATNADDVALMKELDILEVPTFIFMRYVVIQQLDRHCHRAFKRLLPCLPDDIAVHVK